MYVAPAWKYLGAVACYAFTVKVGPCTPLKRAVRDTGSLAPQRVSHLNLLPTSLLSRFLPKYLDNYSGCGKKFRLPGQHLGNQPNTCSLQSSYLSSFAKCVVAQKALTVFHQPLFIPRTSEFRHHYSIAYFTRILYPSLKPEA